MSNTLGVKCYIIRINSRRDLIYHLQSIVAHIHTHDCMLARVICSCTGTSSEPKIAIPIPSKSLRSCAGSIGILCSCQRQVSILDPCFTIISRKCLYLILRQIINNKCSRTLNRESLCNLNLHLEFAFEFVRDDRCKTVVLNSHLCCNISLGRVIYINECNSHIIGCKFLGILVSSDGDRDCKGLVSLENLTCDGSKSNCA